MAFFYICIGKLKYFYLFCAYIVISDKVEEVGK